MKKILYSIVIVVALSAGWFLGFRAGLNKADASEAEAHKVLNLANAAASLRVFSEISEEIRDGRHAAAKCKADISASRLLEQVNECIQNEHCRAQLSDVFEEQIPSVLANKGLSFKYYGSGEACEG